MPVTIFIPGSLRALVDEKSQVELEVPAGGTLRDALHVLWMQFPGVRDRLINEQGNIREHINLFVGSENVRHTGGFATPLPQNAEITIVPAISGG
jgi:molybdopterin converting factor small subunit